MRFNQALSQLWSIWNEAAISYEVYRLSHPGVSDESEREREMEEGMFICSVLQTVQRGRWEPAVMTPLCRKRAHVATWNDGDVLTHYNCTISQGSKNKDTIIILLKNDGCSIKYKMSQILRPVCVYGTKKSLVCALRRFCMKIGDPWLIFYKSTAPLAHSVHKRAQTECVIVLPYHSSLS